MLYIFYFLLRIGALAKYRCERGYKMVGEALVTCEDNGQWSGAVPECVCKYYLEIKMQISTNTTTGRLVLYQIYIRLRKRLLTSFIQLLKINPELSVLDSLRLSVVYVLSPLTSGLFSDLLFGV